MNKERKKSSKKIMTLIIVSSLLLLLIILSGCDDSNNDNNKPARKITGTQAIGINIEGSSKIELFGNYDMTEVYQITLENKGKYNVDNNELYIDIGIKDGLVITDSNDEDSGERKVIYNSLSDFNDYNTIELEGLSQTRLKGDSVTNLVGVKTNVPSGQGVSSGIEVNACYKYETIFTETICLNTVRNGIQSNCDKQEYSFSRGQGAPIKISKVKVSDRIIDENLVAPRLIITIENSKKEIVTLPENYVGACTSEGDINKIRLESAQLGTQELSCQINDNIIDLSFDNKNTIICDLEETLNTDQGSEFTSVLGIVLSYGYASKQKLDIDITRN